MRRGLTLHLSGLCGPRNASAALRPCAPPAAPRRYKATIGADFLTKEVMVDDRLVTMQALRHPPTPAEP